MAELKASEIKYSTVLSAKQGDLILTATQIETPASAEYVQGGVELNKAKLGLPDEAVSGTASVAREAAVGETASTTALPVLAWCNPLSLAKEQNEEGVEVKETWVASIASVKGKLFLRVFAQVTAGAGKPLVELKTATKVNIGLATTTVFVLGK